MRAEKQHHELRTRIFQSLEEFLQNNQGVSVEFLLANLERILAEKYRLSPEESLEILTQYIASKRSAEMSGAIRILPDWEFISSDHRLAERYASFVWAYVGYRTHYLPWRVDYLLKRAHFDLGNSDEDTLELLRWCEANPMQVVQIFEHGLAKPDLSTEHRNMLEQFRSRLVDNSLRPVEINLGTN